MDALARWDGIFGEEFCKCGIPIADLRIIIVGYAYAPFVLAEVIDLPPPFSHRSRYSLAEMFDRSEFTIHYRFDVEHMNITKSVKSGLTQVDRSRDLSPYLSVCNDGFYRIIAGDPISAGWITVGLEGEITIRLIGSLLEWIVDKNPPIQVQFHAQDLNQTFVSAAAPASTRKLNNHLFQPFTPTN